MKKLIGLFSLLFVATFTFAQQKEGHIIYKIDITTASPGENPQMDMAISMMEGSTMEIFFKDDLSRSDINMGALMSISAVTNTTSGETLVLMSGMIGKRAITSNSNDIEEEELDEEPKFIIELFDESKEIAGYTCKKAILTTLEDDMETTYWYTDKVNITVEGNKFVNDQIPGFPMEISLNSQGMLMNFMAESFVETISKPDEVFSLVKPEGYEEMTMEQFLKMGM